MKDKLNFVLGVITLAIAFVVGAYVYLTDLSEASDFEPKTVHFENADFTLTAIESSDNEHIVNYTILNTGNTEISSGDYSLAIKNGEKRFERTMLSTDHEYINPGMEKSFTATFEMTEEDLQNGELIISSGIFKTEEQKILLNDIIR